jgi:phosphoglycerate dehydrogenase-like enzyme
MEVFPMKILFYAKLNKLWLEKIDKLHNEFPQVDFITDQQQVDQEIENAEAIVAGEIPLDLVQRAKSLKIIFVPYAGVDALPLDHIRGKGIRISNVHGNARYVAERSIALALSFYGKVIAYHNDLKNFQWHGYWAKGTVDDTWESIQGKTCAVIGTGAIGKYIAKYLKIFDCRVIGFKKQPAAEGLEYFDDITTDLKKALDKSELVFVTLPLTEETRGMFSGEILAGMKGKFLVNVGRGPVVDEEGLYHSLKEGRLIGAGIDAWYNYPERGETRAKPSQYPVYELPNVVLSPHLAGFTPQAARLNIEQTIENIRSYVHSGKPKSEIDPEHMY